MQKLTPFYKVNGSPPLFNSTYPNEASKRAWREGRRKENHYSFKKKKPLQKSKALVYQIHSVRIKEFRYYYQSNKLEKTRFLRLPSQRYTEKFLLTDKVITKTNKITPRRPWERNNYKTVSKLKERNHKTNVGTDTQL